MAANSTISISESAFWTAGYTGSTLELFLGSDCRDMYDSGEIWTKESSYFNFEVGLKDEVGEDRIVINSISDGAHMDHVQGWGSALNLQNGGVLYDDTFSGHSQKTVTNTISLWFQVTEPDGMNGSRVLIEVATLDPNYYNTESGLGLEVHDGHLRGRVKGYRADQSQGSRYKIFTLNWIKTCSLALGIWRLLVGVGETAMWA